MYLCDSINQVFDDMLSSVQQLQLLIEATRNSYLQQLHDEVKDRYDVIEQHQMKSGLLIAESEALMMEMTLTLQELNHQLSTKEQEEFDK